MIQEILENHSPATVAEYVVEIVCIDRFIVSSCSECFQHAHHRDLSERAETPVSTKLILN